MIYYYYIPYIIIIEITCFDEVLGDATALICNTRLSIQIVGQSLSSRYVGLQCYLGLHCGMKYCRPCSICIILKFVCLSVHNLLLPTCWFSPLGLIFSPPPPGPCFSRAAVSDVVTDVVLTCLFSTLIIKIFKDVEN
jgi:hypothetical protein